MAASQIACNDVSIAIQDSGGDKPPVLLLHGFGATLLDWSLVTAYLTPAHRVIAMDLRDHGLSGSGAWEWPLVLDDIESVLKQCGAEHAVIAGHSLGGIIATMYGHRHPKTPGIINFDGFGRGQPENYVGIDPQTVAKHLRRVGAIEAAHAGTRMSDGDVTSMVQHAMRDMAPSGMSLDAVTSRVRRRLQQHSDGVFTHRPDKAQLLQIFGSLKDVDVISLFSTLPCPGLIVRATRAHPDDASIPTWAEIKAAYALGIGERLEKLTRLRTPHLSVQYVDATHALLLEIPEQVARIIVDFNA